MEETLENKKHRKLIELKESRFQAITASFQNFDIRGRADLDNIEGAITYFDTLKGAKPTITWTLADDTEKEVTKEELQSIKDGYVFRKAAVFAKYQSLKALVETATTKEELEAITWENANEQ